MGVQRRLFAIRVPWPIVCFTEGWEHIDYSDNLVNVAYLRKLCYGISDNFYGVHYGRKA